MKRLNKKQMEQLRKEKEERLKSMLLKLAEENGLEEVLLMLDSISTNDQFDNSDRRYYTEAFADIMRDKGVEVIEYTGSLAEQYKIEAFKEQLADNPYQLKLIA